MPKSFLFLISVIYSIYVTNAPPQISTRKSAFFLYNKMATAWLPFCVSLSLIDILWSFTHREQI